MKNTKKTLISNLLEIKNNLSCYLDEDFSKIYNLCIDYMNDTKDWKLEDAFYDFNDEEIVKEYVKHEIDKTCDLQLISNILSEVDFNADRYRIDAYWYVQNIEKNDIEYLVDDLVERLSD